MASRARREIAQDETVRVAIAYAAELVCIGAFIVIIRNMPAIEHFWWRYAGDGRRQASPAARLEDRYLAMRPALYDNIRAIEAERWGPGFDLTGTGEDIGRAPASPHH